MAENIVDALIVTMGLDNSDYERGMNEVEDRTRQFSERAPRDVERGLNSIEQRFGATFQGIFRTFIAPLTAALGTMGIFSQYTQTADRIGKTAARIGASAEDLQAFGEAAKRAGGSVEGFISSFESLNGQIQRMQAMGGKGRLTPILEQLGISATENGKAKDTFQILRELAGASERIGKQKFAGLARFLGLDQGTIMLLQSGRVAMDELIARQRALGVYTKEDFEITQKFNDAISDLQQSFRAMAAPILQVITPALTTLAKWLTNIVQTFREHQGFIVAGLTVIAATMSGVLLKAATALGAALMPLLGPIAAIAGLGAIFDEIATYAEGGETAFQGLWEAIGTPEDFKAVGQAVKGLGDSLSQGFDAVIGVASELFGLVSDIVKSVLSLFSPGEPSGEWNILKSVIDGIAKTIKLMVGWVTDLLNLVKSVIKWIRSLGGNSATYEQAVSAVTGGKPKEQYIAEQAAEIKKANPRLTDEEATKSAERQLSFNAGLKRDYDTFNGNRLSLESMGYHEEDIDAFEKAMSKQAQAPAPVQNESSSGWWASLFGGNGKAADTAATITSRAPDRTQMTQNNRAETSNSYETNIGSVTVNTAATDAQGIARDLPGAIRDNAPLLSGSLAAENRGSN